MPTALLHDGSSIEVEVEVRGEGPAILLPVSTVVVKGEAAEQMRAWGVDPGLGHTLATALAEAGFRVITADYEGHVMAHPKPSTLDAAAVAADLLAIADAAGAQRFGYYGYSWLALAGLQLAVRTDRLTGLVMGGFPPLGGPYPAMLTVTLATHRMAVANASAPPALSVSEVGDWDSGEVTLTPAQSQQFVTLYESLAEFDERAVRLDIPRLAFAGEKDNIRYGPRWDDAYVEIGAPLSANRGALEAAGWRVEVIPGADHVAAMRAAVVLPLLTAFF